MQLARYTGFNDELASQIRASDDPLQVPSSPVTATPPRAVARPAPPALLPSILNTLYPIPSTRESCISHIDHLAEGHNQETRVSRCKPWGSTGMAGVPTGTK